ncbi:peptidoglycan-binding protein [Falsiroseomonas sp. HW251]|uniref:peptidoglycan-binding protein n=1 Tax=Falsiroseomonas sp. HW251 TaxID=3390998 RepID=UPI003D314542
MGLRRKAIMGAAAMALALPVAATAQPARVALVIGNATYAEGSRVAAVPGCAPAARQVSAALRRVGFRVTERLNVGRGAADVAIAGFARELRDSPGAVGVAYVCGQMASLGDRAFLLPASATMEREADAVTQGIVARGIPEAMIRAQAALGLVVLDGFVPSRPAAAPLATALRPVAEAAAAGGIGFAAALDEPRSDGTPLAAALEAALSGPQVRLGEAMASLRGTLPPGTLVSFAVPANPGFLAGEPPPPPVVAAPAPPPAAAPPVDAPAPAPAPVPAAVAITMPDEPAMTEGDRRRVQQALARLGYYSGQADGVFGPNTRAAIRRYQFELGTEMTGTLTAAQASRLVQP